MHIVKENLGENLFRRVGDNLAEGGLLILYGPYKYDGDFTTQSNADFDAWLKERNPHSGIRDFEWVNDLADQHGLSLQADLSMPANNQMLIFQNWPSNRKGIPLQNTFSKNNSNEKNPAPDMVYFGPSRLEKETVKDEQICQNF